MHFSMKYALQCKICTVHYSVVLQYSCKVFQNMHFSAKYRQCSWTVHTIIAEILQNNVCYKLIHTDSDAKRIVSKSDMIVGMMSMNFNILIITNVTITRILSRICSAALLTAKEALTSLSWMVG